MYAAWLFSYGISDGTRFLLLSQGWVSCYRGTSLIRKSADLRPYCRTMPGALWTPKSGELFLMSEVPLYGKAISRPGKQFEPFG